MTAVPLEHSFQDRLAKVVRRPKSTTGVWSWFTTVDHKKIAILYGATSLVFFVVAGLEALLIRLQLFSPDGAVLSASQYNTMFTMHGTTMVFMVGMPMAVAFGNYLVPLMIGARDMWPFQESTCSDTGYSFSAGCSSTRDCSSAVFLTVGGSDTHR